MGGSSTVITILITLTTLIAEEEDWMSRRDRYKGDVLTQAWIDSRVLATLSAYLDLESVMTRFVSEIVREVLEMVVANLVRDGKVEMVEFTEDARRILQNKYRVNLNPKNKKGDLIGGRNIQHNLELDNRRQRGGYRPESRFVQKPVREREDIKPEIDKEFDMDKAVQIFEDLGRKELEENARKEVEKVLANADIGEGEVGERVITPIGTPDDIVLVETESDDE